MILRKAVMGSWVRKRIHEQLDYFSNNEATIMGQLTGSVFPEEQMIEKYKRRLVDLQTMELEHFPSLPFVMINSRVFLQHPGYSPSRGITICFPEDETEELGWCSFLSPIGQQLLLKQVGDTIYDDQNPELNGAVIEAIEYSSSNW